MAGKRTSSKHTLALQRKVSQRCYNAAVTDDTVVTDDVNDAEETEPADDGFHPLSADCKAAIYEECTKRLSNSALGEGVCCVCDCMFPIAVLEIKQVSQVPALRHSMLVRLKPPRTIPPSLQETYNAVALYKLFEAILLSSAGLCYYGAGQVQMSLCPSCFHSLSRKNEMSPPKFAIANGLFMGTLPVQFADSTPTENAMMNLTQPTHFVSVVRGGRHSSIRSHAYVFRAVPTTPANLVPNDVLSCGNLRFQMVGPFTPEQRLATGRSTK